MKANELRIGNWVYNDFTREDIEVYPMMIHRLSKIEGEHHIKPIPLTEEWLIKFGFEKDVLSLFNIEILKDKDPTSAIIICLEDGLCEITRNSRFGTTISMKYVHQLQNLYFALTGEELEIKD